MKKVLINPRTLLALLHDLTAASVAWFAAYLLRFNFAIPAEHVQYMLQSIVWIVPLQGAVFIAYGLTNTLFSYLNSSLTYFVGGTLPFIMMILIGSILSSAIVLIWKSVNGTLAWNRNSVLAAIPLGLPNFFSFYFLLKALDAYQNNAAVVLTMYNLSVILLSAITAYVFFKERLTNRQWIGLAIGCVGIALLNGL